MQQTMYIPTGNKKISLPKIRQRDAAIMDTTFLHMGYRGMVEVRGSEDTPFLKPVLIIDGKETVLHDLKWETVNYWIPQFTARGNDWCLNGTILVPVGERGFIVRLCVKNISDSYQSYEIGLMGCWTDSVHVINESKPIDAEKVLYKSNWNDNYIFDLRRDITIFSMAPMTPDMDDIRAAKVNDRIEYTFLKRVELAPEEKRNVDFFWGFGMEEVGAATAAKEMLRQGFDAELKRTADWLNIRVRHASDSRIDELMNKNLFFNFFFAAGQSLDTEEFVLVTSRSPRYYVSAAYWDRDSFLWSFPSILLTDPEYAREMLEYAFTRQIRNIGIHSRYIDGTVLEPGFELDELCAPILALCLYVEETGDLTYMREPHVKKGIERVFKILATKKHPNTDLYESFLQPTDDPILYPYLTYNNVLVWKMCREIGSLYNRVYGEAAGDEYMKLARRVREAILTHCVVEDKGERVYAWSVDLNGHWNVYDEPPGSLELMPWHGFFNADSEAYVNTVKRIRDPEYAYSFAGCPISEIGCEHAPHPWILSLCNSMLCGRREHVRDILQKIVMDNGYACESVDEEDGTCRTGEAFATCAGFFAYGLYHLFGRQNEEGRE